MEGERSKIAKVKKVYKAAIVSLIITNYFQENGDDYEEFFRELTRALPKEVTAFTTKPYKGSEKKTPKMVSKSTTK